MPEPSEALKRMITVLDVNTTQTFFTFLKRHGRDLIFVEGPLSQITFPPGMVSVASEQEGNMLLELPGGHAIRMRPSPPDGVALRWHTDRGDGISPP